jgi:hypothetical protein
MYFPRWATVGYLAVDDVTKCLLNQTLTSYAASETETVRTSFCTASLQCSAHCFSLRCEGAVRDAPDGHRISTASGTASHSEWNGNEGPNMKDSGVVHNHTTKYLTHTWVMADWRPGPKSCDAPRPPPCTYITPFSISPFAPRLPQLCASLSSSPPPFTSAEACQHKLI